MIIKKFVAASFDAALSRIRTELGPKAVILKTRIENSSPHDAHPRIEITAAVDADLKCNPDRHAALFMCGPEIPTQEDTTGRIPAPVNCGDWLSLQRPFPGLIEVIGW